MRIYFAIHAAANEHLPNTGSESEYFIFVDVLLVGKVLIVGHCCEIFKCNVQLLISMSLQHQVTLRGAALEQKKNGRNAVLMRITEALVTP